MKQLTGEEKALFRERLNRRKAFETVRWYVIRTLSNQEERVADIFRSYGVEVFIPKAHDGWINEQDQTRILYPNLIYVHLSVDGLFSIMRQEGWPKCMTPCLDRTRPHDQGWMQFMRVSDDSMQAFKMQATQSTHTGYSFSLGDKVQITAGLWTGHSGTVLDINPTQKLILVDGTINDHICFSARVPFDSVKIEQ